MSAPGLVVAAGGVPPRTAIFLVASALTTWAVILSVTGMKRPDFPGGPKAAHTVLMVTMILVLAATTAAVATS